MDMPKQSPMRVSFEGRHDFREREAVSEESLSGKSRIGRKILEGTITVSIFLIFLGIPIFFMGKTLQGLAFEKQLYFYCWLLVGLVAWVTKSIIEGEMRIRKTPLDIPILVFLGIYIISTIASVDRWHSIFGFFGDPSRGLVNILALAVFYYMFVSVFNWRRFTFVLYALFAGNAIVALWSLLAFWTVKFLPENIFAIAPLSLIGSITGLGIYFSMMIPVILAAILRLASSEKRKQIRIVSISSLAVLLVLNIYLLLSIYSFNPWLATVLGVSLFLIYIISGIVKTADGWGFIPMGVFMVIMGILLLGSNFGNLGLVKANLPTEVSPNMGLSWSVLKDSVKENIFIGSGPATYGYVFTKYKPAEFNANSFFNLKFYQAQGMFFEYASTIGVLGAIAFSFGVLAFVGIGFYFISKRKEGKAKLYSLGFFSASLIFLTAALFNRIEGTMLIFGAIFGILSVAVLMKEEEVAESGIVLSLKTSPKFALAFSFLFLAISTGVVFVFLYIGKVFMADVFAARANRGSVTSEQPVRDLSNAIALNPREGRYYTNLSQRFMALANAEYLKKEDERNIQLIRNYLVGSTQAAKDSENLMKNDIMAIEAIATVYENAIRYLPEATTLATEKYTKALELDPESPVYQLKLGQLKITNLAEKKEEERAVAVEEAEKFFNKAIEKKADYDIAYYYLGLVREESKDLDGAIENMTKAFGIQKRSAEFAFELARLYQKRAKGDDLDKAENIYKEILKANDKHANTKFMLAMVYEAKNDFKSAATTYEELLGILPEEEKDSRDRVSKMLSNARQGIKNKTEGEEIIKENEAQTQGTEGSVQNVERAQQENNLQNQTQQPAPAPTPAPAPAPTPAPTPQPEQ